MKKLILCSLVLILTSCTAAPTAPAANSTSSAPAQTEAVKEDAKPVQAMKGKAKSCICAKLYMPVCGEDKKTYGNACEADCAGVKYTGGACEEMK